MHWVLAYALGTLDGIPFPGGTGLLQIRIETELPRSVHAGWLLAGCSERLPWRLLWLLYPCLTMRRAPFEHKETDTSIYD